jgi:hypothetical protein
MKPKPGTHRTDPRLKRRLPACAPGPQVPPSSRPAPRSGVTLGETQRLAVVRTRSTRTMWCRPAGGHRPGGDEDHDDPRACRRRGGRHTAGPHRGLRLDSLPERASDEDRADERDACAPEPLAAAILFDTVSGRCAHGQRRAKGFLRRRAVPRNGRFLPDNHTDAAPRGIRRPSAVSVALGTRTSDDFEACRSVPQP